MCSDFQFLISQCHKNIVRRSIRHTHRCTQSWVRFGSQSNSIFGFWHRNFVFRRAFDTDDAATLSLLDAGYSRVSVNHEWNWLFALILKLDVFVSPPFRLRAVYDWITSNCRLYIEIARNSIFVGATAKYYRDTTGKWIITIRCPSLTSSGYLL